MRPRVIEEPWIKPETTGALAAPSQGLGASLRLVTGLGQDTQTKKPAGYWQTLCSKDTTFH
jgi:hypothetical protein